MHLEAVPHAQRDRARVAPRSWPPEAVAVPEAVRIHRSPLAAIAPLLPKGDTSIRMPLVLKLASPPLQVNPSIYCITKGYLPRGKDRPKGDGAI